MKDGTAAPSYELAWKQFRARKRMNLGREKIKLSYSRMATLCLTQTHKQTNKRATNEGERKNKRLLRLNLRCIFYLSDLVEVVARVA